MILTDSEKNGSSSISKSHEFEVFVANPTTSFALSKAIYNPFWSIDHFFLVSVLPPLLLQYAIDRYILQQDLRGMMLMLLALVGLGSLIALQNYSQRRLSQYVGLNIVKNLRNDLFEHISQQPFEFFDK